MKDTDSPPPYELLDDVLDDYIEGDAGHEEIVAMGFDSSWRTEDQDGRQR